MRDDTSIHEKELIPIRLVQAVGALLLVTLLMVGYARLSDMPLIGTPKQVPVVSQTTLEFVKQDNGSVSIYNDDGVEIINSRAGPYGFIVVVYNGFMSERKKKKIETNNPLKLVHYEDGRLTIIDEVSSWDMHLNSFGAMNASVFKKLIN
tara:strand:+ start:2200 stop:2649 length:450 start_codon:yes stop_codon:yes gene_type:complete